MPLAALRKLLDCSDMNRGIWCNFKKKRVKNQCQGAKVAGKSLGKIASDLKSCRHM
jgi:hypothetical protein